MPRNTSGGSQEGSK